MFDTPVQEHVCNSVREYLEILADDVCAVSMRHDLHKAQRGVCRPRPPYRPQALGPRGLGPAAYTAGAL